MHPFGSGRWQHVLELNAQVTIRQCSDEAQYLEAFRRHKVEEKQRVQRQLGDDGNRDSDDKPLAHMVNTEEEDESMEAVVTASEAKVTGLRAELKEHTEKIEQLEARHKEDKAEATTSEAKVARLRAKLKKHTEKIEQLE